MTRFPGSRLAFLYMGLYMGLAVASGCGDGTSVVSPGRHDLLFRDTFEAMDAPAGDEATDGRADPWAEDAEDEDAASADEGGDGATDTDGQADGSLDDPGGTGTDGEEAFEDPGNEDPGTADPGAFDEGATDPGTSDPGVSDPGTSDPGSSDPGTGELYTGIYAGLEGVTGSELARRLCLLVDGGYKSVGYSTAGDLVRDEVDNFGGKVEEIYSGIWQNPGGLNMEHTWPQSKGADGIAKSDMFHLYASNPNYNSPRGNMPYGNVVTKNWPSASSEVCNHACTDHFPGRQDVGCCSIRGTDSAGSGVFEPRDAHKGNVARAVFYFALKYQGCERPSLSRYDGYGASHTAITESVHKEWNHLDPPDADEQARNDRIHQYQKVRNPFIDHPEFIDRIDFTP